MQSLTQLQLFMLTSFTQVNFILYSSVFFGAPKNAGPEATASFASMENTAPIIKKNDNCAKEKKNKG